jgi:hypothetical protein
MKYKVTIKNIEKRNSVIGKFQSNLDSGAILDKLAEVIQAPFNKGGFLPKFKIGDYVVVYAYNNICCKVTGMPSGDNLLYRVQSLGGKTISRCMREADLRLATKEEVFVTVALQHDGATKEVVDEVLTIFEIQDRIMSKVSEKRTEVAEDSTDWKEGDILKLLEDYGVFRKGTRFKFINHIIGRNLINPRVAVGIFGQEFRYPAEQFKKVYY